MTVAADRTPAEVLLDLDTRGIVIDVFGERLRLRPTPLVTDEVVGQVQACKSRLMSLLAGPRRRWRAQAEALITSRPPARHEDLLHIFDEREAIASVDGGLTDHEAGGLAYEELVGRISDATGRTPVTRRSTP